MWMRAAKASRPVETTDEGSGVAESASRIVSPVTDIWTQASPWRAEVTG
jgi:hypothetical protein